jgi:hypothetical protein
MTYTSSGRPDNVNRIALTVADHAKEYFDPPPGTERISVDF